MNKILILVLLATLCSCHTVHKNQSATRTKTDSVTTHKVDSVTVFKNDSVSEKSFDSLHITGTNTSEKKEVTTTEEEKIEIEYEPTGTIKKRTETRRRSTSVIDSAGVGFVEHSEIKDWDSTAVNNSDSSSLKNDGTTTLKKNTAAKNKEVKKKKLPVVGLILLFLLHLLLYWLYRNRKRIKQMIITATTGLVLIVAFVGCTKESVPTPDTDLLTNLPQPHKEIAINIQQQGVRPTNGAAQNSDAIESFFNSVALGTTPSVYFPHGDYQFARAIKIDSRPGHYFGDSGSPWALGTRLFFPAGIDGMVIDRKGGYQGTIIQNISVNGNPNSATWASGISAHARVKIISCSAKGFSHNGIDIWANVDGEGTDASGSLVFDCVALENAHDGFFAGRVDANAISFITCDARDNGRYGFNDDSFLGNWFEKCMAHYNKGGDFFVRDKQNARSSFRDCYTEGGNTPSSLSQLSTVSGGLWGTPYTR